MRLSYVLFMKASQASVGTRETPSANSRGLAPTRKFYSCLFHRRPGASAVLSIARRSCSAGSQRITAEATHGVQNRTLENIPRLTAEDKAAILGHSAVGCFQRERVQNDVYPNGHPLFWCEWKPISLYTALFRDCDVTNVVDLSIGSGAAADGALYNNCNYFGVCFNDKHMDWVRSLLQQ